MLLIISDLPQALLRDLYYPAGKVDSSAIKCLESKIGVCTLSTVRSSLKFGDKPDKELKMWWR